MKPLTENSKIGWLTHTDGHLEPKIYFNHLGCMLNWSHKYNMVFLGIDRYKVAKARNTLVNSAKALKCTHLLIVDSDHSMPNHALECLSKNNDAMIVSGLVTKRKPPYPQVGFVRDGDYFYPVDLTIDGKSYLVDMPAMGCTLIDMEVFNLIDEPYFIDTKGFRADGSSYNKRSDANFFEKCREANIKMIIDTRVLVGHLKEPELIYPNCVPNTHELNKKDKIHNRTESLIYQAPVYELLKKWSFPNNKILDLGCGNPAKLFKFSDSTSKITGVDFPEKILDIALECNKYDGNNATWKGHDLSEELDLKKKFDIVICSDVIEHVEDTDVLLKTIKNHMDDNSILIISSPEKATARENNGLHVKEFTKEELLGILTANGLSVIDNFSYQESHEGSYTNNVYILNKELENGNCNSSRK